MAISSIPSSRLRLEPLSKEDASFIYELVNSEGWLKFIGDRNVNSLQDAEEYITNIMSDENTNYWVVNLENSKESIGVITLIKKDYLDHPDVGFAFLPAFEGKGYAYESASAVLEQLRASRNFETILACTLPENNKSQRLLER